MPNGKKSMAEQLLNIDFDATRTLQDQIKEHMINLILGGFLPIREPLPSSRKLSGLLGVSRNTISLIYESLLDSGYLISEPRKGYFIAPQYHRTEQLRTILAPEDTSDFPEWERRFRKNPSQDTNIIKPNDWSSFEYPFIYGQIQNDFFPMREWRQCSRKALSGSWAHYWINDQIDTDDPMLVEQLRTQILPRRGIYAEASEILITIGTQNSLYLLANLLMDSSTVVGLENPGFRDAYNIFSNFNADVRLYDVDHDGLQMSEQLHDCHYLYLTPSHQVPTGVELSLDRKRTLLEKARTHDIVLIEDDYDSEINVHSNPAPALKAMDSDHRVVYTGSLSKSISPGIRLGYLVADEELISEIRALRRLMYRHTPTINQRQVALFLSQGYYDAYLRKIRDLYSHKEKRMYEALRHYMPGMMTTPLSQGASSVWLEADPGINTEQLSWRASKQSILIEPGATHFLNESPPQNYFRLGFSAIATHKIEPGIAALSQLVH